MTIKLINIIILIIFPFLFVGLINKVKAFWAGRKGASILQPFYDFVRLVKKGIIVNKATSIIFQIAPAVTFASILFAGLLVPIINFKSIISFDGNFILFAYILGLGKFFSLIGAMDTGSSFEGMGASREASFSTIVEPAFFILLASVVALTGNYTFESFSAVLQRAGAYGVLIIILAVIAIFIMLLVEGCRVPIDDPNTHLELTMIHEVMVLDNSGIDLGLILYGSAMKMLIFASLIANILIPSNLSILTSLLIYSGIILLIVVIIGTIESSVARLRMSHVFEFIFVMSSLALVVLALVATKLYGN